jgi:hypothetical protein
MDPISGIPTASKALDLELVCTLGSVMLVKGPEEEPPLLDAATMV